MRGNDASSLHKLSKKRRTNRMSGVTVVLPPNPIGDREVCGGWHEQHAEIVVVSVLARCVEKLHYMTTLIREIGERTVRVLTCCSMCDVDTPEDIAYVTRRKRATEAAMLAQPANTLGGLLCKRTLKMRI